MEMEFVPFYIDTDTTNTGVRDSEQWARVEAEEKRLLPNARLSVTQEIRGLPTFGFDNWRGYTGETLGEWARRRGMDLFPDRF